MPIFVDEIVAQLKINIFLFFSYDPQQYFYPFRDV